jgi:hypothetical protein
MISLENYSYMLTKSRANGNLRLVWKLHTLWWRSTEWIWGESEIRGCLSESRFSPSRLTSFPEVANASRSQIQFQTFEIRISLWKNVMMFVGPYLLFIYYLFTFTIYEYIASIVRLAQSLSICYPIIRIKYVLGNSVAFIISLCYSVLRT